MITSITNFLSYEWGIYKTLNRTWAILADVVPTTVKYIVPNFFRWHYQLIIGRIQAYPLTITLDKITTLATLYLHHTQAPSSYPVLLLHGHHSHPYTTLHLAKLAEELKTGPIFSLYLPYEEGYSASTRSLITQAFGKIVSHTIKKTGCYQASTVIGHSMGGMQAVHKAFVEQELAPQGMERRPLIDSVIAIAAQFKLTQDENEPCPELLRPMVNEIDQAMLRLSPVRLCQIAAEDDWIIPLEVAIGKAENSLTVPHSSHLGVLYHQKTLEAITTQFRSMVEQRTIC